ncbi:3'(2'),5'-bisphosphate nucleotidase CysQ [Agaricicola taiwanensis]|uniref:3'(2'),5'-bisphosphate nucleotidase CysQ n=1 Tax=Agaricicola taiwanensis TaxID=591372 RepID=A0A8J2YBT3_9RHOB|nr:3'(2'),5'-bisphosphate nucleotidase CysQ [Agaricicola taiwanensis]GGE34388.1 3'(2'),5'-bisphosphate nucleotidase CysQ [Agaricicola taiwanensis]
MTPEATAPDLDLLAPALDQIMREAGEIAAGFFHRGARRWEKADSSPVTEGDIAVDTFLKARLPPLLAGSGWLSEETADTAERLQRSHVWVVDPIDGTRAFADGIPMWVISVALVERGRPVLAAIFNPLADEYFEATAGGGARLNGQAIMATSPSGLAGLSISGPAPLFDLFAAFGARKAPWVYALAYRLVHVAAGRIDVATARTNPKDWDLAAADLILHEAGAVLTDLQGRELTYNRLQVSHPALIAAGRAIHSTLVTAIASQNRSSQT